MNGENKRTSKEVSSIHKKVKMICETKWYKILEKYQERCSKNQEGLDLAVKNHGEEMKVFRAKLG